ncbi:unnamed protein product [Prorocentrum cordatum]|uniref:FHA domain-containing protein n=1 Tax=Prorocentrum cordatum TaxID=2364126 RepID=A0ABN9P7E7_9DINO|nr:unnamed protein product [Polarella glacialis]
MCSAPGACSRAAAACARRCTSLRGRARCRPRGHADRRLRPTRPHRGAARADGAGAADRAGAGGRGGEWCLVCTGAARDPARPAPAVALPVRPPSGGGSAGVLRVGLSLQEPGFWEALVPDPGALDGVSPEHFELFTGAAPSGGILINLSEHGTLVNGELVHESHRLAQGDVVGLPRLGRAEGEAPVVEFRLLRGAAGRPQAALAAPPGSPRASWGASGALDSGASGACGPTGSAAGSSECAEAALPAASALLGFGSAGPLGSAAEPRRGAGRAAAWQAGAAAADSLDLARAAARRPEETGSPLGRAAPERPFALECTQSRGLLGRELERLPARLRVLEASGCPPGLRLGRAVQPPAFWQALLPREDLRNTVSREHFELAPQGGELRLTNRSVFGTLVNNELVTGEVAVRDGDTISEECWLQRMSRYRYRCLGLVVALLGLLGGLRRHGWSPLKVLVRAHPGRGPGSSGIGTCLVPPQLRPAAAFPQRSNES